MVKPLVHPRMIAKLANFFPQSVTIQANTGAQDGFGQPQPTWADLSGHVGLAGAVAGLKNGKEIKREDMTVAFASHAITLAGDFPTITSAMRAVSGTDTFDIVTVERDSQRITTILRCQVVTT